jgi:hypothetical protein
MMNIRKIIIVFFIAIAGCGGEKKQEQDLADTSDILVDCLPDVSEIIPETAEDEITKDTADADPDITADNPEADSDASEILPALPTQPPLSVPSDPLKGTNVTGCSIYKEETCESGLVKQCNVYDTKTGKFVPDPDILLNRALLFDRWRDLYNSPDGETSERNFTGAALPGTPESEWGKPEYFSSHQGTGDSGIWTGWTTVAAILRYSQTGTEADYLRMEKQVRNLLLFYEVTGVPGYLCRYHYLLLPPGAPKSPDHVLRYEDSYKLEHHDRPVDEAALPKLPAIYTEGIKDKDEKVWKGKPMWHGRPSIDQNTGPMTSLPMAYALLKDEELKKSIVHHLTCYLKRLQRVELINLQKNPDLIKTLMAYFGAGELKLDPDDIDLMKLDRIVGYVHRQINSLNETTYDKSCPATVQMAPWRVIDATSDTFILDLLEFIQDMDVDAEREKGIDHYYFPSIRGGDAMHMMHLSTMAYYFTGDEMYRKFLYEELTGNLHTIQIAHTAGAFDLPKFCKKFFGDQITYGPWWAFLHLLGDCGLRTEMQKAFHKEMWDKLVKGNGNADFSIMYAGAVPDSIAADKAQALAYALDQFKKMGGNGFKGDDPVLDDPRRSYSLTPDFVMAHVPEGIEAECPTKKDSDICTAEIDFMGIKLPGLGGFDTHQCTGSQWECDLGNGKCTDKMTNLPLPVYLRPHTDFLWQRNPFALGKPVGIEGQTQYPGSDLSEVYWNARRYGFIKEGEGQVLAWETAGKCE